MNDREKEDNEEYIRQMQEQMNQKEAQMSALIDELTRKSALNEDELLLLKQEVDQERRKSMADQQKIKKIEAVLKDNTYKAEDRIRELQDALEA